MEYTFKPISKWPGERTQERESARFKSQWHQTEKLLERELQFLDAKNIVIQADCDSSQIRIRDGMLKAGARLASPGVIISFDSKYGSLSYPCDKFNHHRDNIRAIALALEALRKVDRYGVTRRAEQYTGWKALPNPHVVKEMSHTEAAAFVAAEDGSGSFTTESMLLDRFDFRQAYKLAAKRLHPDGGGSHEQFAKLQQARQVLDRYHGER